MLCMRLLFLLYLSVVCSLNLSAQLTSRNKKAQQAFEEAGKMLRLQHSQEAIQLLKKAIVLDPTFSTALQQLGDVYRSVENYKNAIPCYTAVLNQSPTLTPLTQYGLGESLLFEGHYKEALPHLQAYLQVVSSEKSKQLIEKHIADCYFAIQHQTPLPFDIELLPATINTANDEYFPQLTADSKTIVFTRKVNNQENFFQSEWVDTQWSNAQKLVGQINSDDFNEGAHCISPDGKYLFFTGCNRPNGLGSCDIYVSKKENGVWSEPFNLGTPINTKGWESQPAISADGKTLYFVSNRVGGNGGYDIWKSTLLDDGRWGNPINLGNKVNTNFDESAPYIHADNKSLYFASTGWPGFGRLDLYKSTIDSMGEWTIPYNLGQPINNNYKQMAIHVSVNGKIAHLASQDSSGQLDIYSFQLPENLMPAPVAYIQGMVQDAENKKPLAAQISVTNTSNQQIVYEDIADPIDGKFIATLPIGSNYAVHVQKEGYLFDSKQYALDDPKYTNERFDSAIELQRIKVGGMIILNNIYFDSNKFNILPGSATDLQVLVQFLKLNSTLKFEIAGHTDNSGNADANQKLSENRAKAVKEYLTQKQILASRIIIKGYGSSIPSADNSTEEGRRLNRRTEFKILNLQ